MFSYDDIPESLRVQIVQIMLETLGNKDDYYDSYSPRENVRRSYKIIVEVLRKEIGVFKLPHSNKHEDYLISELTDFILQEQDTELVLSAVELICRLITNVASKQRYKNNSDADESAKEAIQEINARFKEHGLGYEYDGEIIRIDTELVHVEAVKPALSLLRNKKFSGPEQEFQSAYTHFRKGKNKEALNDALKAFESTMKSIYDKREWNYDKSAPASKLIKVAFDNQLVPIFWANHFSGLRKNLEVGIPTARNKMSGHGQGATPTEVPVHLVAYVLHQTASTIVFLVKSDENLP